MFQRPALFFFELSNRDSVQFAQLAKGLISGRAFPALNPAQRAHGNPQLLVHLLLCQSRVDPRRPQRQFQTFFTSLTRRFPILGA